MTEMVTLSKQEKERLEERARKSAMDKSYLQLVINLIQKMSAVPGLDSVVGNMLRSVAEVIGGTNILVYYWIDDDLFCADVFGRQDKISAIGDPLVLQVQASHEAVELEHDFSDTKMTTAEFGKAYTWAFPLLVKPDLIGIIKLENLHIGMRDLYEHLPAFFNYAALVLKNEIRSQTRLQKAFDALCREMSARKQAEEKLLQAKAELERRVEERTAALQDANRQLNTELAERERIEEALRENEARLSVTLEVSSAGIWQWDTKSDKVNFDARFHAMLGYTPGELPDALPEWLTYHHPEDLPVMMAKAKAYMDGDNPMYESEHRIRAKGGTWTWVFTRGKFIDLTTTGRPEQFMGIAMDVTGRKRTEEVQAFLAQTSSGTREEPFFEALARYLAQSLGMDFVCIDRLEGDGLTARTVAVWCDGRFEDNVSYALKDTPCGEVVGKTVCCFPASVCQFFPRDQVLQDLRAESYIGVTLFGHTGVPIGLIAVIGRAPLASRALAEAVLKTVAVRAAGEMERLEAEQALRANEEHLRITAEAGNVGLWDWDLRSNRVHYSSVWKRQIGFEDHELSDDYGEWQTRVHPDDLDRATACIRTFLEAPYPNFENEFRLRHKDGSYRTILAQASLLWDQDGRPTHMLGSHVDITERKRAEEALRKSEERYAATLAAVDDGLWDWHVPSGKAFFSAIYYKMLGYEDGEFPACYDSWRALVHSQDIERVEQGLRQSIESGEGFSIDLRMKTKSGDWRWVSTRGKAVEKDAEGKALRMVGTLTNITERKRLERALETRLVALTQPLDQPEGIVFEELFELSSIQRIQDEFASATGVASIITQPDGTPITRPSNFCRLCEGIIRHTETGRLNCYHSDAILGRYHPDGPIIRPCLSGGLWDAGASITIGERHIANWLIGQVRDETQSEDKMREYARAIGADETAVLDAFREVPAMSLARFTQVAQALFTLANQLSTAAYQNVQQARFIHERNQAEKALRESRTTLAMVLDTVPQSIFWKDLEGRYLGCNRVFAIAAGLDDPAGIIGKTDFDLPWPREEAEAYRADDREVIESNRPKLHIVEQLQQANAARIWIDTSKVPMRDASGRVSAVLGVYSDITERKKAEEEKAKLEGQLLQAQKMESVGRLAGGVAHDFNNMLQAILINVDLALSETPADSPVRESLHEILSCAQRSADLTRQLLAFARKQTVAPKVLDLNETLAGMLKMLERLIGEDIHLAWQPGANLWTIKMDPSQIDQILANLCVNARDAIADIGKITIETNNKVIDEDFCAGHVGFVPGEYVRLAVSDSGCGMDRETLVHVFEPFFTTKGLGEGTGLGLATVYGIVKQNGGFINVYSEPGHGTTFTIYLPRHLGKAKIEPAHPQGGTEPVMHGQETILLVEDEPTILNLTARMLKRLGYTVLAASTPGEAIRLAEIHSGEIHLLMTDVVMPEMNGRDLAKNLLFLYPDIRRLFMSGYTADVIAHHGVLDPGIHFIQKPFSMKDLVSKIQEALAHDNS